MLRLWAPVVLLLTVLAVFSGRSAHVVELRHLFGRSELPLATLLYASAFLGLLSGYLARRAPGRGRTETALAVVETAARS